MPAKAGIWVGVTSLQSAGRAKNFQKCDGLVGTDRVLARWYPAFDRKMNAFTEWIANASHLMKGPRRESDGVFSFVEQGGD
jgi:hypothetical protein